LTAATLLEIDELVLAVEVYFYKLASRRFNHLDYWVNHPIGR
jgi:hypothetical protein